MTVACKICGSNIELTEERRYTARERLVHGAVNVVKEEEPKIYDAFDCPTCGCQYIAQERKHRDEEIEMCEIDLSTLHSEEESENA